MTYLTYDAQRKSPALALLIEFLVPGLGSLYGDHAVGSLITWVLILAGIGFAVWGVTEYARDFDTVEGMDTRRGGNPGAVPLTVGLVMILGGRIYGFVDSYRASDAFNERLRIKLGLPPNLSLGVGPVAAAPGGAIGFGPRLRLTF
jgi:hypothetical protein